MNYAEEQLLSFSGLLGSPHTNVFSHRSEQWYVFSTSQCGWVGLNWQIHSKLLTNVSPWPLSSTLNQDKSGISSPFSVGHFLVHVSNNKPNTLWEPYLHPWAATLDEESPLSEPISIKSAWPNMMILPSLSHLLSIHSLTCSLNFCWYNFKTQVVLFGLHNSSWVTLCMSPLGA